MEEKKQELKNQKIQKHLQVDYYIDYLQVIDDIYENLEDYNSTKIGKVLIVFDDMIAHMEPNKKLYLIATELFLREKTQYFTFFMSQSYFKMPKL